MFSGRRALTGLAEARVLTVNEKVIDLDQVRSYEEESAQDRLTRGDFRHALGMLACQNTHAGAESGIQD